MIKTKDLLVTKASGIKEQFSSAKIKKSLIKAGADEDLCNAIVRNLEAGLYPEISTTTLHEDAFNMLNQTSKVSASRYNLKRAVMSLGPTGYPFEQYIGRIFGWMGYEVKLKQLLNGRCVTHEIDVLAENSLHTLLVECKFHSTPGVVSDVKVPLYIDSRYKDVLAMWNKDKPGKELKGAVVTNTKFSTDAIKYGTCSGLQMLAWDFPEDKCLNSLVIKSRSYPITCLSTLSNTEKEKLLQQGVVMCDDVKVNPKVLEQAQIHNLRVPAILAEIMDILP